MTLATDLKNLKPGYGLVMRDGTLRSFQHYSDGWIVACGLERPFVWTGKIGRRETRSEKFWDIVRVIKAKKAKPDKDAVLMRRLAKQLRNNQHYSRTGFPEHLDRIANRLEAMK